VVLWGGPGVGGKILPRKRSRELPHWVRGKNVKGKVLRGGKNPLGKKVWGTGEETKSNGENFFFWGGEGSG